MERHAIELTSVAITRAQDRDLGPTDLVVRERERIALVGPSGSGKSTLLRLTVGLEIPDAGSVEVFGERMTNRSALRLRRRMGYVIQEGGLFPHWTGIENVVAAARALRWDRARILYRLEELRALAALDDATLRRFPAQLSGGERQRIALMRALFLDPALLLFDEPLGALDPIVRYRLESDLQRIFRDLNKTVVWVTHDLEQGAYLCDELVVLRAGRVEQRGTFEDLARTPASEFVGEFVAATRPRVALGPPP